MTGTISFTDPDQQDTEPQQPKRRSAWRQRLIEAERGFGFGLRSGSSLFGQFFFCLTILLAGAVFGLGFWEWIALTVSMMFGFAAELGHATVLLLSEELEGRKAYEVVRLSAAAMVTTVAAAGIVVSAVLIRRLVEILS